MMMTESMHRHHQTDPTEKRGISQGQHQVRKQFGVKKDGSFCVVLLELLSRELFPPSEKGDVTASTPIILGASEIVRNRHPLLAHNC
jgi:hypothetical protein